MSRHPWGREGFTVGREHAPQAGVPDAGMTRRGVIGAGVAAGAGGVLGVSQLTARRADAAPPAKPCAPEPEGIPAGSLAASPSGRHVWTTDTRATTITPHHVRTLHRGAPVDVGGAPVAMAITTTAKGPVALVTTAAYDRPGLSVVDLTDLSVNRLDVAGDPGALATTRDGHTAWVIGRGAAGTLVEVRPASGRVGRPIRLGSDPLGIALDPQGAFALVALNGEAAVALVDLAAGRVTARIATAAYPAQLALSPDGRRALVTHNGFGARTVSLLDVRRHRVGRRIAVGADPAGVAFSRSGRTAIVTSAGAGTATVLDGRTGVRRRRKTIGGSPRAAVVCGSRGLVADALTGRLTALRLGVSA